MIDASTGQPEAGPRCNWCSAPLPSDHESTCPSCGATLVGDGQDAVPGLTAIDAEAILRNARAAKPRSRSRLLGWISGEYDEGDDSRAAPGSLAPPPEAVRREMLRLELEAQVANARAEVDALAADDAVEEGRSLAPLGEGVAPVDEGAAVATPADSAGEHAATDEAPPA